MSRSFLNFLSSTEFWVGALGLTAFLALFWVLRGAPVGQAVETEDDADAPRGGYRDRVVAAVTVGMMLVLAGAYVAMTKGAAWSIPAFVLGFGTVLALVVINQRHRHSSPTLRRTVDLSTSALNASLVAGILVVVNVIAFRYGGKAIDMTREGAYSLSSLSHNQVKSLQVPVSFTTFFGRNPGAVQQYDRVEQLLELYRAANPDKVRLDHIDPYRDLVRYQALAKRVPDIDVSEGGGVIIEYGAGDQPERVVVRNADLFELPRNARFDPDVDQFKTTFKGEDAITSALIRLREGKKPRVVFTTGHGEPTLEETAGNREGMGVWRARLAATGSDVASVNLLTDDVPEGTSLLVVAGPKTPFRPDEVSRLKGYSDRKGPVLVLAGDTETTGLEAFLDPFGVRIAQGLVVEPRLSYRGKAGTVVIPVVDPKHPILAPLRDQLLLFIRATPLKVETKAAAAAATVATVLLRSTPQSWAKTDIAAKSAAREPDDPAGPFDLGVAVNDRGESPSSPPGAPRLVVYSSRYLGDNGSLSLAPEDLDLLMNTVNWLRGRPDLQGIAPKEHVALTLTADPLLRARLILVPTVLAVLMILTLGVTTYLARRD